MNTMQQIVPIGIAAKLGYRFIFTHDRTLSSTCNSLNHSLVLPVQNPTMCTTPYADGAYPRYVIAFHKNAQ